MGDRIFHDFANWMMPLALAVVWAELNLLDWVWVENGGVAHGSEVL